MADETWPSTLPQYVNEGGFQFALSLSSYTTGMSTGYAKKRKKYTGQYATYSVTMNCTLEQLDTFEQFFYNNLGYGVVLFDFPDPLYLSPTIEVRIKGDREGAPYSIKPYRDSEDYVLSFQLERLISGYTTVPISTWPSTLPQCAVLSSYRDNPQSGIIRDTNYSTGFINVRRRFTAISKMFSLAYVMDLTQLETFFNFYASLGYGSLDFIAPYPTDEARTMRSRFENTSGYQVEYYNGVDLFLVSCVVEELPLIKEYI